MVRHAKLQRRSTPSEGTTTRTSTRLRTTAQAAHTIIPKLSGYEDQPITAVGCAEPIWRSPHRLSTPHRHVLRSLSSKPGAGDRQPARNLQSFEENIRFTPLLFELLVEVHCFFQAAFVRRPSSMLPAHCLFCCFDLLNQKSSVLRQGIECLRLSVATSISPRSIELSTAAGLTRRLRRCTPCSSEMRSSQKPCMIRG